MPEIIDGYQRGAAREIGPRIRWMLSTGQQVTLQVSGDSMRPTLKPRRDAVVLEPLDKWPPRKRDILFFESARSAGGYSLHRMIRARGDTAVMNGDAQGWIETVAQEDVIGRVVALVRKGKMVDVNSAAYRAYAWGWRFTRPFRKPLFALWRSIKGVRG